MIIFRTVSCQIVIKGDEYAIYSEYGNFPNGEECENLVICTPNKKYTLVGIDSGVLEGFEVVVKVLDYIKENIDKDIIYIDLDELCGSQNAMEDIVAFVNVSVS